MKKIVHLLTSNKYGGAESIAMDTINNLKSDYSFTYVSPNGPIKDELKEKHIEHAAFELKNVLTLIKQMRVQQPDIIHAHDFKASLLATFLFRRVPVISHIHQAPEWQTKTGLKSILYWLVARKAKRVIYVSDWAKESFVFSSKLTNSVVIENAINIATVKERGNVAIQQRFDIVFVGRLERVKNPQKFLRIMTSLLDLIPTLTIGIVGEGSLHEELAEMIRRIPNGQQITLLGFQTNPYKYTKAATVLMSTSDSEAFGLTVVEAAVLGTIPVATNINGINAIVHSVGGVLFSSEQEAVAIIHRILSDSAYRQKLLARVDQVDEVYFDQARFLKAITAIYDDIQ